MQFYDQEKYIDKCEKNFQLYKDKILEIIPGVRVEHIGASAIKGAISKGDLDIFIGVNKNKFEEYIGELKTLGFHEKKDTLRTSELCMLETYKNIDVAIQVVVNGSEFEFFLEFRDKLNQSPKLVEEYNQMKRRCKGLEHEKYREEKSNFIESVLNMD